MTTTVTSAFLSTTANHPELTALRSKRTDGTWDEMTWSEVADRVARYAAGLKAAGVRKGDRVALFVGNRPEFHIADLAVLFLGATPVSIYMSSSPMQVKELTQRLDARLLISEENVSSFDGPAIDLAAASQLVSSDDLATIIFTSGTTSKPKGVMLSHANVTSMVNSVHQATATDFTGKRVLSYLPLAHVAERLLSHYLPVYSAMTVTTCPNPALLATYLPDTRPHLFFGVPRVWDKLHSAVEHKLADNPTQQKVVHALIAGGPLTQRLGRSVFEKIRVQLGLDQVIFAASGAAPLSDETATWIKAVGVPFSEIYGMSETTGPITWSPNEHQRSTVGKAMPGVEVRLLPDGEVICRGSSVFAGYLDDADATNAALHDGWLCTGDIGEIDSKGYLKIVDRKKDLIITAGGKNISPAVVEAKLETNDHIAYACVIGDRRLFISAIINVEGEITESVVADIDALVAKINSEVSQPERIKRFEIVNDAWVAGSDLVTPTFKVRRRGVETTYATLIAGFYTRGAKVAA